MKIEQAIAAGGMVSSALSTAAPGARWSDWVAAARRQEAAIRDAVSALRHAGARIHVTPSHSRMEFAGVRSSSTTGGRSLLEQWLAAAHSRLEAKEKSRA